MFRNVCYLTHQQQVDLLTLKVVSESRVTWATSMPILVFLGLSVLKLGPMYATGRQTSDKSIAYNKQIKKIILSFSGSKFLLCYILLMLTVHKLRRTPYINRHYRYYNNWNSRSYKIEDYTES